MSKITNDGITRSGTGCFIAVPILQQWASEGQISTHTKRIWTCQRRGRRWIRRASRGEGAGEKGSYQRQVILCFLTQLWNTIQRQTGYNTEQPCDNSRL